MRGTTGSGAAQLVASMQGPVFFLATSFLGNQLAAAFHLQCQVVFILFSAFIRTLKRDQLCLWGTGPIDDWPRTSVPWLNKICVHAIRNSSPYFLIFSFGLLFSIYQWTRRQLTLKRHAISCMSPHHTIYAISNKDMKIT